MKLTRENIYINLQGKSKEELTELYDIIIKDVGFTYPKTLAEFIKIYKISNERLFLSNHSHKWLSGFKTGNKQEVTIQQLKQILQPMENKEFDLKGYSVEVDNEVQAKQLQEFAFKQGFEWCDGKNVCLLNKNFFSFNAFNENLIHYDNKHFKDEYVTKEIHFNDIFKTEPTLTEQLEKAEAEVNRLKEAIEESNKPNIGDWLKRGTKIFKVDNTHCLEQLKKDVQLEKIQDQELINKLNELIK